MPGHNGATSSTNFGKGAASIWNRDQLNWTNEYLYEYTSPVSSGFLAAFGNSVSLDGNKLAVGAPSDYAGTTGQGARAGSMSVLAYNDSLGTWSTEQRLYSTTPTSSDYYGTDVTIRGNTLVTANYALSATSPKIFVYTYQNGTWGSPSVIIPVSSSGGTTRYIGHSTAINSDESMILIGSKMSLSSTDNVGRVFVLRHEPSSSNWTQAQTLASPTHPTSGTYFGNDVAFAGATPVVAAPAVNISGQGVGALYTYQDGDGTPPTFTFQSAAPSYTNQPYDITIITSEPVLDFTQSDLSISSNATLGNFTSVSNTEYTVRVTPTTDGPVDVRVSAGMVHDSAGNANTASSIFTRTFDSTKPLTTFTEPAAGAQFNSSAISVTVRITDANGVATSLEQNEVSVTNGTISGFTSSTVNNYIQASFSITPTSEGPITLQIAAGAVTDQAGNANDAGAVHTLYYDTTAPTPQFTTSPNPTNESPFPVTLTFSEPISNETSPSLSHLSLANGTAGSLETIVPGQEYRFMVTPSAPGDVTIEYLAGKLRDKADNLNLSSGPYGVLYDTFGPEVTIGSPVNETTNVAPIPFHIHTSEPVNNLTANDVTVVNGEVSTFTQESSTDYDLTVTPDTNGAVSVSVSAQRATDAAGNGNQASNTKTILFDTGRPAVTIAHDYLSPTNQTPLAFTITFSEAVTDLIQPDIHLTNATVLSLTKIDARTYDLSVIPSDGVVQVSVSEGAVQDAAGNSNSERSESLTYDGTAPAGTVDRLHTSDTSPRLAGTVDQLADRVEVTIGTTTHIATIDQQTHTWYVPRGNYGPLDDGVYEVSVKFVDKAGNVGWDTTQNELIIDTDQPHVTLAIQGDATNKSPVIVTLSSDNVLSGLSEDDFEVTNGSVTSVTRLSETQYTIAITPATEGEVNVWLPEKQIQDMAGNPNTASNTVTFTYDVTSPTFTLSGPNSATKSSFVVVIDADEDVIGLSIEDVITTNATISSFVKRTNRQYSLTISPIDDGEVTARIENAAATDYAENASHASTTFRGMYDTTAPLAPTVDSSVVTSRKPRLTGTFSGIDSKRLVVTVGKAEFVWQKDGLPSLLSVENDEWVLDFSQSNTSLEYGVYDIRVTAFDAAGNTSFDGSTNELIINSPGQITATVDQKITAESRPELSGTVSRQDAVIAVKIGNDVYEAQNNRDGSWSLPAGTIDPLTDGIYDIELTLTSAELEGSDTTTDELTVDSAAPGGTLTRIISSSGSPALSGTVDTRDTSVSILLEGKRYEGEVVDKNRWQIAAGTISPALAPGKYMAVIELEKNDTEAMSVVRNAITVTSSETNGNPEPIAPITPRPENEGPITGRVNGPSAITHTSLTANPDMPNIISAIQAPSTALTSSNGKTHSDKSGKNYTIITVALVVSGMLFFFVIWAFRRKRRRREEPLDQERA